MERVELTLSKRGLPCIWEKGGAYSSTGDSFLIADRNGKPKKAIYIRRRGQLACKEHALIPITVGDYTVSADQHYKDFTVSISEVVEVNVKEEYYNNKVVNTFSEGEWDNPLPEEFEAVVEAAKRKAMDYHCRSAYYIKEED